jgi:hypothetical protein
MVIHQRRRLRGTDDATWRQHDAERSKGALIDRQEQRGREAFKSHLAGRATGSGTRVKIARHLSPDATEIECDRLATDLHTNAYRNMLAEHHAIVVHKGLSLIHAVWDRAHGSPRQALALREDELDALREGPGAVALEELGDAALPRAYRCYLCPEIAHGTVRSRQLARRMAVSSGSWRPALKIFTKGSWRPSS